MRRNRNSGAALLALLLVPALGFGQGFNPYAPAPKPSDPRARRAAREHAVAQVPEARAFVEAYGEDAVAVLFATTRPVGKKLAAFHGSGDLDKLPRPADLLRVIASPNAGDDVAVWAMDHAQELRDVDHFQAYLAEPMDYALALRSLAAGAAEFRSRRLQAQVQPQGGAGLPNPLRHVLTHEQAERFGNWFAPLVAGLMICLAIALVRWWRKRRGAPPTTYLR